MNKSIKVAALVFNILTHLKIIFKCKNISSVVLMLINAWVVPQEQDTKEITIAKDIIRTMLFENTKNI